MKKLTFLLMLVFFGISFSQETRLQVTESIEFSDKLKSPLSEFHALHKIENGRVGLIRSDAKKFYTYVFSKDLDNVEIEKIKKEKNEDYQGHFLFENEIRFISVVSTSKKDRTVYCNTFNILQNSFQKEKLFETSVENGGLFNGRNKRLTNVVISPNGKYFAVATDNIKKNINAYKIHVFETHTLKLVFEKSYNESDDNNYFHNDLFIDNHATVYSLGKLTSGKFTKKDEDSGNYTFTLSKLTKDDYLSTTLSLDDDNYVSSLILNIHDDVFNLTGFYSERKNGFIKGICNFNLDSNSLELINNTQHEIPTQVYDDLFSKQKAKKSDEKKSEFKNFYIDHVITDEEGNLYIVAEKFFSTSRVINSGPGVMYTETILHFNDILAFKVNVEGELVWGRGIYKRSGMPTYNAFYKNNELHILMLASKDLSEKSNHRTNASQGLFKGNALYDFTISADGEINYNKIRDNKNNTNYVPFNGTYGNGRFMMVNTGIFKRRFMILE